MGNVFRFRYCLRCFRRSRRVIITSFGVILVFYIILFYDVTLNSKPRSFWILKDGLTYKRNLSDHNGTGHSPRGRLVNTSFIQLQSFLWDGSNDSGIAASRTRTIRVNLKGNSSNKNNGNNNDNKFNNGNKTEAVKGGNLAFIGTQHSIIKEDLERVTSEKLKLNNVDSVVKMTTERNNSVVSGTGSALDTSSSNTLLLAGVLRPRKVYICIGMVTVARVKGDYFFDTLASLMLKSSTEEKRELTVVVMVADGDQTYNSLVLRKLQDKYAKELNEGLILVVRGAQTDFLFQKSNVKRTYNDSLDRVKWRSKQNLDYAALMEFSATRATYYLHLEDDVLAADNYLSHIRAFIQENEKNVWAMLEVCPHGFIGKLFKTSDLAKLVMVLRTFYLEQPCDFLMNYFFSMMTQSKRIIRKQALFFHQGKFSSLTSVTRKVDKIPGADKKEVAKTPQKYINPPATVSGDLTIYDNLEVNNAYNLQTRKFLWAKDVKKGQRLTVHFHSTQQLTDLVIETGFSQKNRKDILHKGIVELGKVSPDSTEPLRCPGAEAIGDFKDGRFSTSMTSPRDVGCLSIVISEDQKEWLIIREIAVFTNLTSFR